MTREKDNKSVLSMKSCSCSPHKKPVRKAPWVPILQMRKMRYKELEDFSKETQLNRVLSNIRLRPAGASGSSQG